MERAFGPCPAKPVLPFEMKTVGGSLVSLTRYGGMSLLGIRRPSDEDVTDTACTRADLRLIAEACLKAAA